MQQSVETTALYAPWLVSDYPRLAECFDRALTDHGGLAAICASPESMADQDFFLARALIVAMTSLADAVAELELVVLGMDPATRSAEIAECWTMASVGRLKNGQNVAALAALERALDADPACWRAVELVPLLLQELGRPEAAAAAYERRLALKPGDRDAAFNSLLLLWSLGETQRARAVLDTYMQAGGVDRGVAINAVWIALHEGWLADVKDLVERALAQSAEDELLWNSHYTVSAGLGDYATAMASARRAQELNPALRLQSFRLHLPVSA